MNVGAKKYFVLINYKTNQKLLCSWWENEPDYFGRTVFYIGVTNGLGGYHQMIEKVFIDRRFNKPNPFINKTHEYIYNKMYSTLKKLYGQQNTNLY